MRTFLRLVWTALVVRELTRAGVFDEVRITMGEHGLESKLFVRHHGVLSIMGVRAALSLCASMQRAEEAG